MTDISVTSTGYQAEKRSWLISAHGTEYTPSITLDVSAFTAATHYPDGYIKSGVILAQLTATKKYVPYVDAGSGGAGVAVGILFSSVKVPNLLDLTKDVGGAILVHGAVNPVKLPIANGASGGGFIDANGQAELKQIFFETN